MVIAIDLVFTGTQSNGFQTTDRIGPADVIYQPNVPMWSSMVLNPGDGRLKTTPWTGLNANLQTYPFAGSRQWCGIPEFCVYRLSTVYGIQPRLIKLMEGATSYDADWPNYLTSRMQYWLQQAKASNKYPGAPTRTFIITIHGESDVASFSTTYGAKIPGVIAAPRTVLGATTTAVVCQLNSAYNGAGATPEKVGNIRGAQSTWVAGDSFANLFDLSPYPLGPDQTHYASTGAQLAGYGLADRLYSLL